MISIDRGTVKSVVFSILAAFCAAVFVLFAHPCPGGAQAAPSAAGNATYETALSKYFGFRDMEVYKGSQMMRSLKYCDANSDSRPDICYIDVEKSQITVMLNGPSAQSESSEAELNSVRYDQNFRNVAIPLEKNVYDYQFVRLAGDSGESLLLVAEPKTLILMRNDGNMQFSEYSRVKVEEADFSRAACASFDIDGDSREDVVIMAPDFFIVLRNGPASSFLSSHLVVPLSSDYGSDPAEFSVFDADSDSRPDIVYAYNSKGPNFRVRYGSGDGLFLNEESFELLGFRNMDFFVSASGKKAAPVPLMACVLDSSNRLYAYRMDRRAAAASRKWKLNAVYFSREDREQKMSFSTADVDGDGNVDLVAANGARGRVSVFFFGPDGRSTGRSTWPLAVGAAGAFAASASGEVVLFAVNQGGLVRGVFGKGTGYRFAGPDLSVAGSIAVAPVFESPGSRYASGAALLSKESGEVRLRVVPAAAASASVAGRGYAVAGFPEGASSFKVAPFSSAPEMFIVYQKYDSPLVFARNAGGSYAPLALQDRQISSAMNPRNSFWADFDADGSCELALADKKFLKIFRVDASAGTMVQKDQVNINFEDFNAEYAGSVGGRVLAMDPGNKRLYIHELAGGRGEIVEIDRKISQGQFVGVGPYAAAAGDSCLGVLTSGPRVEFEPYPVAPYEENRKGKYNNLLARDVNGDGVCDIVATCGALNMLDIFTPVSGSIRHAFRFKVFNTKQFQGGSFSSEPSQLEACDLDSDGYADIIMMVHDKIIIYYGDRPDSKRGER